MQTETDQQIDVSDDVRDALCLAMVPGIGPRTFRTLVDAFGSPTAVLAASPSMIREIPGIGSKLTRAITQASSTVDVVSELQRCHDHKIRLLALSDHEYPQRLKEIDDAPPILYARGDLTAQDELAVAIVGTRHATNYGLRQADRLGREE